MQTLHTKQRAEQPRIYESLEVTGFAGIQHVELVLREFNLLIGPQATGKSILAKLLFFAKGIIWRVVTAAENDESKREMDQHLIKRFEELFPQQSWGKKPFKISYKFDELNITLSRPDLGKNGLEISYSQFFHSELTRLKRVLATAQGKRREVEEVDQYDLVFKMRESFVKAAQEKFGRGVASNQLFIPAGRSFFANLQSSIFSFLSGNNAIDPFLKEFGSFYENIKRAMRMPSRKNLVVNRFTEESGVLIQEILRGKYVVEKGRDYLDVVDGRRIDLGNCSSGQQETLPLALILQRLPFRSMSRGYSVYIEEPEAHLFPTAQRFMLELIALTFNAAESRLQILITTHSPYVLTALNNLLEAGALYGKLSPTNLDKLAQVVPQNRTIPMSLVSAYSVNRNGCESIIDLETGLLKTDLIDDVSTELAVQFDKLLDLH